MKDVADPLQKDDRLYTYADYETWPEGERWELIDGVAYDMSPAPGERHQLILGELHVQFHAALAGSPCRVYLAPFDVRMPDDAEPDGQVRTVVQPDLTVVCERSKVDERGVRGAPDLAVEILSPTTAYKDQTRKLALYERKGVPVYWIVNPERGTVTVHRLGQDGRYGRPLVAMEPEILRAEVGPGVEIDLGVVFRG